MFAIFIFCVDVYTYNVQSKEAEKGSKNKGVIERQGGMEREREKRDVSGLCGGPGRWQSASDFHSLLRWMRSQPDQEQTAAFLLLLSLVFLERGALFKTVLIFGGHYACTPDQRVSLASPRGMMERPNLPLSPALHKGTANMHGRARARTHTHTEAQTAAVKWS